MVSQWSYVFTSQFYTNYFSLENRLKINGSIRGTYFFLQYSFGNYLYSLFVMIKWLFEISKMFVGFCLSSPNLMYVPRELLLMEFHSSLLILHVASMCCFLWACLLSQKHFFLVNYENWDKNQPFKVLWVGSICNKNVPKGCEIITDPLDVLK